MRILHLSDPHFGTVRHAVMERLLQQVQQLAPELIIFSGDITQRARPEQFREASAFLRRLPPVPVVTVPGNHDIPLFNPFQRLLTPYKRYTEAFYPSLEPELRFGEVEVIAFNSAPRWRHVNGALALAHVESRLAQFERRARILVCVFHHPLDCRRHQDQHNLVRPAEALARLLSRHRVDLVLGGHIHDPLLRTSAHRYPALDYSMVLTLAGTCISGRTRLGAPNSFNLIELQEGGEIYAERWDWKRAPLQFEPVWSAHFRREVGQGWREQTHGRVRAGGD